jgi:hypothetical protein
MSYNLQSVTTKQQKKGRAIVRTFTGSGLISFKLSLMRLSLPRGSYEHNYSQTSMNTFL